jgi:hypothetical protein
MMDHYVVTKQKIFLFAVGVGSPSDLSFTMDCVGNDIFSINRTHFISINPTSTQPQQPKIQPQPIPL